MSILDQRILIVAPGEAVWLYLTDPVSISKWNRGAKQLSMLTTKATGVGMRRRCVDTGGRAVVEEMTAWLDNIGYEYTIIDGPYKTFKGRIRLQPMPDGTLVNWSMDYQLRGMFGGLRDALGYRRRLRGQMAESLRALKKAIEKSGIKLDPARQAKVAMQADPGIAVRMARMGEPTRPAAVSAGVQAASSEVPTPFPTPTPSFVTNVAARGTPSPIAVLGEDDVPPLTDAPFAVPPTLIRSASPSPAAPDDTKPRPPPGLRPPTVENVPPPAEPTVTRPTYGSPTAPTVPLAMVAPPPPPDSVTETIPPHPNPVTALPPPDSDKPDVPPPLDKRDTGEMSIWDVFGLEKPSERSKAELDAVIASLQTPPPRPASRMYAHIAPSAAQRRTAKAHIRVRPLSAASAPTRARAVVRVRAADGNNKNRL